MKHKKLLLGLLLLLGIGFALVSTTLLMTGNVKIATNNADFDVRFTKTVLDGTDISETAISGDGKIVTFRTSDLSIVGDISRLDFEVTNNSEMYDAEISVSCTASGAKNSYYKITEEVASPIAGKRTGKGKVEVSLIKVSVGDFSEEFTCTLTATAKERTAKAIKKYIPKYFEFGEPTTASTQDYTTLKYPDTETQAKVFVGLDEKGQKAVCIVKNETLECFKNGNWEEEKIHITELFSDITYSSEGSVLHSSTSDFYCDMNSDGYVNCGDTKAAFRCSLSATGRVNCH